MLAGRSPRINDPERMKVDIIAVATAESSSNGRSGTRIDPIAGTNRTSAGPVLPGRGRTGSDVETGFAASRP